jgi:hypothetical protein
MGTTSHLTQRQMIEGITATMNSSHQRGLVPSAETQAACAAFVRYMNEVWGPLPIDPVMLLISYERYQSALAAEAADIECLGEQEELRLQSAVRCAVVDLQDKVGGTGQQNADAIGLKARGIAEHIAERLDR